MTAPRAPQDRQAPKARARKPAATKRAATATLTAEDRIIAETKALGVDWITVPDLAGSDVRVRSVRDWPRGVYQQLTQQGDMDAVADVIHPDDVEIYLDPALTFGQLDEWIGRAIDAAGQTPGESRASRRSRGTTRAR